MLRSFTRLLRNKRLGFPMSRVKQAEPEDPEMHYIYAEDQKYNTHKKLVNIYDFTPQIFEERMVSPSAVCSGEVSINEKSFVGNNSVLRGELNAVCIGRENIIMENCSISTVSELDKTGNKAWTLVSTDCMLQPGATLISAELESGVTIGANSVVCEGARVGEYAIIGANSVVPPYRFIPGHQLWAGNPVRFVRDLTKGEINSLRVFRKLLRHEKTFELKDMYMQSTAFLQKDVLDRSGLMMISEDPDLDDLEAVIRDVWENSDYIYFEKGVIGTALTRLKKERPEVFESFLKEEIDYIASSRFAFTLMEKTLKNENLKNFDEASNMLLGLAKDQIEFLQENASLARLDEASQGGTEVDLADFFKSEIEKCTGLEATKTENLE